MVLLTMTPGIARAIARAQELPPDEYAKLQRDDEPALTDPKPGNPISHAQLIDLSKLLKQHTSKDAASKQETREDTPMNEPRTQPNNPDTDTGTPTSLASLLHKTTLYVPPPPAKPTQTPEYHALMARLRAEQEALSYEKMLHPPPTRETFNQRFPSAPSFSIGSTQRPSEEDELSYDEVHRQIILIINVLISIVCVAVFIWVAARHWSVGSRLGLSLGGSFAVAVAEVAVYSGYVRKVREAKRAERKKPEIKEIVKTWVLGEEEGGASSGEATGWKEKEGDGVRFRKGKHR
jgi:hypothetical protein